MARTLKAHHIEHRGIVRKVTVSDLLPSEAQALDAILCASIDAFYEPEDAPDWLYGLPALMLAADARLGAPAEIAFFNSRPEVRTVRVDGLWLSELQEWALRLWREGEDTEVEARDPHGAVFWKCRLRAAAQKPFETAMAERGF